MLMLAWLVLGAPPQAPAVAVQDPNRPALLGRPAPGPPVRLQVPSATVMVSDSRLEEVRLFVRWMAPALAGAAKLGEAHDESVQMLAEFMAQDPSRPKAPTLPAFWYNAQKPPAGRKWNLAVK